MESVKIEKARNRILAEDVFAEEPFPPFPASIKDGYAVRSEDGEGPRFVRDAAAAGDMVSYIERERDTQQDKVLCGCFFHFTI